MWCSTSTTGSSSVGRTSTTIFFPLTGCPASWGLRPRAGAAPSKAGWPSSTASCRTLTGGGWTCGTSGAPCSAARRATVPLGTDTWRRSRGGSTGSEWATASWRRHTQIWHGLWACSLASCGLRTLSTPCCATSATGCLSRVLPQQTGALKNVLQWTSLLWSAVSSVTMILTAVEWGITTNMPS